MNRDAWPRRYGALSLLLLDERLFYERDVQRLGPYLHKAQGYRYFVLKFRSGRRRMVYEHIEVLEKKIGRRLRRNEVSHHKNENKLDNRSSNLEVRTRGAHTSEHRPRLPLVLLTCPWCGCDFERTARMVRFRKSRGSKLFCSKRCAAKHQHHSCPRGPTG